MSGLGPATGGARASSAQALSRQINQLITQARNWQVRRSMRRGPAAVAAVAAATACSCRRFRAATLRPLAQELVQVVVVHYHQMNTVNFCTAYHRIAKHVQARGCCLGLAWLTMPAGSAHASCCCNC